MSINQFGAWCFGAVIGWFLYFTMRHKATHAITDLAAVVGAIGGVAVLDLFPIQGLFSWYAIGLFCGFFAYFIIGLIIAWRMGQVRAFLVGAGAKKGERAVESFTIK